MFSLISFTLCNIRVVHIHQYSGQITGKTNFKTGEKVIKPNIIEYKKRMGAIDKAYIMQVSFEDCASKSFK